MSGVALAENDRIPVDACRRAAAAARAWMTSFALSLLFHGNSLGQSALLAEPMLASRLNQQVAVTWRGQAIGAALERLAELQQLPLWIDRRVDPSVKVDLVVRDAPVREVLNRIVDNDSRWGWSTLRTVVYFGPRESAVELATLSVLARDAIAEAPSGLRREWLTPLEWSFPRLSEPQVLFAEAAAAAGAELRKGAKLPHDLWPARSLGPVAPIDRAVLVLASFNLRAQISKDGRQIGAAAIARPVHISREFPRNERIEATLTSVRDAGTPVNVQRRGGQLLVSASWETIEQVRSDGASDFALTETTGGRDVNPRHGSQQRYTVRIENQPVGRVIAQLADQLDLSLSWDAELKAGQPSREDTRITCDVREADLDDLLAAILDPAGLAFERDGRTIVIRAAR